MRPIGRISIFLNKVNWNNLAKRWNLDISAFDYIRPANEDVAEEVIKYWLENPDQRFGQVLINLNLIPDRLKAWNDEEYDILLSQGIDPREFIIWGTYGKNQDQPLKHILLKDMSNEHIQACLDNIPKLHPSYKKYFEDELEYRSLYPQNNIVD